MSFRRTLFICLILSLFTVQGLAQQRNIRPKQRNIFLELAGSGGLGSINLEKPLWIPSDYGMARRDNCGPLKHSSYFLGWRFGFSLSPIDRNNGVALIFPVMINWIYGCGNHKLEIGAGLAPTVTTRLSLYVKSPLLLGYRFEPSDKRWFARVSYTPIVGWLVDYQWQHWGGVSIGYHLQPT